MYKGGREFYCYKFRSMYPNSEGLREELLDLNESNGALFKIKKDPRVTPFGRIIRKLSLDELPQFINVLRGEMGVVGPRPERPHFVGQLARALPLYRARHAVKPGITGWAQTHHRYGNSVEDSRIKLEYDLYYVKHASLYLDLLILLQTVRVVLGFMGQ